MNTIVLVQLYLPDSSRTVGDQAQGDPRVKDNSGYIVPFPVFWTTSDANVGTVDANGLRPALHQSPQPQTSPASRGSTATPTARKAA